MLGASRASSTREYQVLSTTNITSTGSQNYTVTEGTLYLEIEMYGGGGGGGAGVQSGGRGGTVHRKGGGGGGGAYVKHKILNVNVIKDAVVNFTVGAGGAGGGSSSDGVDGAATTLNTITPDGGTTVSLSGPSAGVSVEAGIANGDTLLYEGCNNAFFAFAISDTSQPFTVQFDVVGTATNGVDYNQIPDSLTIFVPILHSS